MDAIISQQLKPNKVNSTMALRKMEGLLLMMY